MGGFEGADHINGHGCELDMAGMTDHVRRIDEDYRRAARLGLRTVRESIGWRLCEDGEGRIDLSRVLRIAAAAEANGVQVLWTLMHYGVPSDLSLLDDRMIERLARFAGQVASALAPLSATAPVYNPINEISFLAWAACETRMMGPTGLADPEREPERAAIGYAVKRRLARAALAAIAAIRAADPCAKILHIEPIVHVVAPRGRPDLWDQASRMAGYQWQALDLLAGLVEPELGGSAAAIDYIGVNHYHNSQWELGHDGGPGPRLEWHERDPRRLGLALLLGDVWKRYGRPLIVGETGHVGVGRAAWLHDAAGEVAKARAAAVPVHGICLYPLLDRPDWNDTAQWHRCGLWHVDTRTRGAHGRPQLSRVLNRPYAEALAAWSHHFDAGPPAAKRAALMMLLPQPWDVLSAAMEPLLAQLSLEFDVLLVDLHALARGQEPKRYTLGTNIELLVLAGAPVHEGTMGDADMASATDQLRALMARTPATSWFAWTECANGFEIASTLPFTTRFTRGGKDGLASAPPRRRPIVPASYEVHEAAHLMRSVPAQGRVVGVLGSGELSAADLALLTALARLRPDFQVVVFGDTPQGHPVLPNLHGLPTPDEAIVPALLDRFAVCVVPSLNPPIPGCHLSLHRRLQLQDSRKPLLALDALGNHREQVGSTYAAALLAAHCDALTAAHAVKAVSTAERRQQALIKLPAGK